jgi:heat shock protein HslJ
MLPLKVLIFAPARCGEAMARLLLALKHMHGRSGVPDSDEGEQAMTMHPLDGTAWRLVSYQSADELVEPPPDATVTLQFHLPDVGGRSAINQYHGTVEVKTDTPDDTGDRTLTFTGFASTMMAGPEPLMALEFRYLELLQAAHTWSLEDERLTLQDAGGATSLCFEPDPSS